MTSQQFTAIADGLQRMNADLGVVADHLGIAIDDVGRKLRATKAVWKGPRARTDIGAAEAYVVAVAPAVGALTQMQMHLSTLETRALGISETIARYESTIDEAGWRRSRDEDPDGVWAAAAGTAQCRIETEVWDWLEAAQSAVRAAAGNMEYLERAHAAYASGFTEPVLLGDSYVTNMLTFAAITGTALSTIDRSGALTKAAEDRVWFADNTELGRMYLDVIDEAGEETASTDPERLRALVIVWGEDNGVELDPATVDFLTVQIGATALAMQASGFERDDDEIHASLASAGQAAVAAVVAGVSARVGYDLITINDDPVSTAQWWAGLAAGQQNTLVESNPDGFGNTNGLPATVRDGANRAAMAERQAELEAIEADPEQTLSDSQARELENIRNIEENLAGHAALIDPLTDEPVTVQLYIFEPAAFGGDGRAAIAVGDVDTADHVAVNVPGFSSSVSAMLVGSADDLYEQSRWATFQAGNEDTVAVIDWMGYDTPNPGFGDGQYSDPDGNPIITEDGLLEVPVEQADQTVDVVVQMLDGAGVLDMGMAADGAPILATDVDGIVALRGDDPAHITVVANSYGSTTASIAAAQYGLAADDLVLSGSPGAGIAETADEFSMGAEHTWVASASSDFVTWVGQNGEFNPLDAISDSPLGIDPADEAFGAQRVRAESVDRSTPLWPPLVGVPPEHGRYLDPGSESMYSISSIVVGDTDSVLLAEPRHQEPFVETHNPVDVDVDSAPSNRLIHIPSFDFDLDIDIGWGSPLEVNAWPTEPEGDRTPIEISHEPE